MHVSLQTGALLPRTIAINVHTKVIISLSSTVKHTHQILGRLVSNAYVPDVVFCFKR